MPPVNLTRRNLLQVLAATPAAAALEGCTPSLPNARPRPVAVTSVETTCGACPAGCGIRLKISEGKAFQLSGVAGHPLSDGGVCPRGIAEIQHMYRARPKADAVDALVAKALPTLRQSDLTIVLGRLSW